VPLMIKLLAGTAVAVSFYSMFISLAGVIFIPFVVANFIKYFWTEKIKASYYTFKPISIVLLGLLIMGIVAGQADIIITSLQENIVLYLSALFIFFLFLHVFGYFIAFWRKKQDRVTVMITMTYMNFTLAIYLVAEFFNQPEIAIPVILSVLPWSILIIPLKFILKKNGIRSK
jgi:predicted Na+-dependent transporter